MALSPKQTAGLLLFVGVTQLMIFMIVASALYPVYNIADNYISDLGVGPTATIFGTSVFICGILIILSAYFCFKEFQDKIFSILLGIAGLGLAGVGIFPETTALHIPFATIAFFFGPIAILSSYRITKPPFTYFALILGAFSLLALILLLSQATLGLGNGGMERMIAYPILIWGAGFGGYLMSPGKSLTKLKFKGINIQTLIGSLLFVGAAQFAITIIAAQALYDNYSMSASYISDLGMGPTGILFNSSVVLFGWLVIIAAYFTLSAFRDKLFSLVLGLAGLGAVITGWFTETFHFMHGIAAFLAFFFAPVSSFVIFRIVKPPFAYLSAALGAFTLVAMVLYSLGIFLGLGYGGIEMLIVYPVTIWATSLGGYFLATSQK